jgi:hypothetical protein
MSDLADLVKVKEMIARAYAKRCIARLLQLKVGQEVFGVSLTDDGHVIGVKADHWRHLMGTRLNAENYQDGAATLEFSHVYPGTLTTVTGKVLIDQKFARGAK